VSGPGTVADDRIAGAFNGHGRVAALMPYLMGGYPSVQASVDSARAAAEAGADLIELGVPFSDPLADGPVIHAAATEALRGGVTPDDVLGVCEAASQHLPVVLMVYANVVLHAGLEEYPRRAAASGAAGLIVPDLPYDEAAGLRDACDAAGIALVPLVAPTTPDRRMAEIGAAARGFVYAVSLAGTTGERSQLPPELPATVERVRGFAELPVAVGFGISTPEQARSVGELADGVIVGTRVVRAAGEGGPAGVGALVAELAEGLERH
jgi:tryptophan synthase alpha chain